jgi:3-methyladenine DNA glycosylase AlkD
VLEALAWLERHGSARVKEQMLTQYGITAPKSFGVRVGQIQQLGKLLGRDHELALALWETGWYEARMLTAYVDQPERITAAQMDRWAKQFDNWGIVDTLCFALWDKTPHAWRKLKQWSTRKEEFVKRAAFALLASLALHDKKATDRQFLATLPLIEKAAADERNFVKKGVSWGFRVMGRRNTILNAAAVKLAERLAGSPEPGKRWVGREALRELTSLAVQRRLAKRRMGSKK